MSLPVYWFRADSRLITAGQADMESRQLSDIEWEKAIFSDLDAVTWNDSAIDGLLRVTKLFSAAGSLLERHCPETINKGLWDLVGSSGMLNQLFDRGISIEIRLSCIESINVIFEKLFAPNCQSMLSSGLREYPPDYNPLNSICYMWWDIFPSWGAGEKSALQKIDQALMDVMKKTLTGSNNACLESALHGLGHWHLNYPAQTEAIIDAFLEDRANLDQKLKAYALSARCGCVN